MKLDLPKTFNRYLPLRYFASVEAALLHSLQLANKLGF